MVAISVRRNELEVRLGALESVMAWRRRVRVPIAAIVAVDLVDKPMSLGGFVDAELKLGLAAATAPGRTLAAVGARASTGEGGRALVVVWLNRRSVLVRLRENATGWRLLLVSAPDPDTVAARLAVHVPPTPLTS